MSDPLPASSQSARDKPVELWTRAQRGVLIAFVLIVAAVLLINLARDRMYVSDPPPARAERYGELADRLDPNTATWQELAVLPQIGEKRAREIVAYRDAFRARQPDRLAFARPQDLMNVKGIGPAMVETIRPHLTFPVTQASTNPVAPGP
jgi:hypothetical protein